MRLRCRFLAAALLTACIELHSAVAAEVDWQPTGAAQLSPQVRVVGAIDTSRADGDNSVRVRGWVVDGFSATRPDVVALRDIAGRQVGIVRSGGFERRSDVEARFGSSAYSLSGFEIVVDDAPRTLVVNAHLGQLGWWQTTVTTPAARRARINRIECVSPDLAEVEVSSADPFPVRDALVELEVGTLSSTLSRYPDDGDLHALIFTLSVDQLITITASDDAVVRYHPGSDQDAWFVGTIDLATVTACSVAA